eukprot:NODE_4011_length_877_cov_57.764493_g3698_i0.p1 GENE.NODE_4011_length_877_cov_57.764493_g3698_i0~~NODE_4011_length_877_cov_57.764493_g3698_i0.p1  ORF type:complete len:233 (+),score=51.32 NODE_4011_length_877_cov_57.764493_g3698_i0:37-699(+)
MSVATTVKEPTEVVLNDSAQGFEVVDVVCGFAHTLVRTEAGQVFAFGKNNRLQLGCDTGAHVNRTQQFDCVDVPTSVPVLANALSCSTNLSAAVNLQGQPLTWGGVNASPELIKRTATHPFKNRILSVEVGRNHTAVLTEKGRLFMSGKNTFGELGVPEPVYRTGNPFVAARTEPVPLEGLRSYNVLQVACGNRFTVALVEDRTKKSAEEPETTDEPEAA